MRWFHDHSEGTDRDALPRQRTMASMPLAVLPDQVGPYLDSPDRPLVLCSDENSQILVLDHTAPVLPMRRERPNAATARQSSARSSTPSMPRCQPNSTCIWSAP